jgi:hypothetical protein
LRIDRAVIALGVLLLVVFLCIWPGVLRYSYYHEALCRVDRLTGAVQDYDVKTGGWERRIIDPMMPVSERDLGQWKKPAAKGSKVPLINAPGDSR